MATVAITPNLDTVFAGKLAYQQRNNITPNEPEKKLNHQANVVRIAAILAHPDPETTNLELIRIGDYQVVSRKGQFKIGDLGVYIQPDSVVPQTPPFEFIWTGHVGLDGKVPEKRRRITVRKFRGQWSEGLLLPITDFNVELGKVVDGYVVTFPYTPGDDVSDKIGVTHYDPDAGKEEVEASATVPRRKYPKTIKGWFHFVVYKVLGRFGLGRKNYFLSTKLDVPEYDVKSIRNHADTFQEGEIVVITEKIHGSNARYTFVDGTMYAGSKTQWKAVDSPCIWRKAIVDNPWIEEWCRDHPGYVLYGEVVPNQPKFDYGFKKGKTGFFLFDIRTPNGLWVSYEDYISFDDPFEVDAVIYGGGMVPTIYSGPYRKELLEKFASGPSLVQGANHIREGIVIKPVKERRAPGVGRVQLKYVSNSFLERDSK